MSNAAFVIDLPFINACCDVRKRYWSPVAYIFKIVQLFWNQGNDALGPQNDN
ncbi:2590_t:CDS:2 [Gigaspora rosea]|nr:2590_t:CDS:2 [Gigaspora rosea]